MTRRVDILPRLMPAPVAAAYLGVSESTLRTLSIPRRVLGAKRLFDRADLDHYADSLAYEGDAQEVNTCDGAFGT
jgi:hypothetical protein